MWQPCGMGMRMCMCMWQPHRPVCWSRWPYSVMFVGKSNEITCSTGQSSSASAARAPSVVTRTRVAPELNLASSESCDEDGVSSRLVRRSSELITARGKGIGAHHGSSRGHQGSSRLVERPSGLITARGAGAPDTTEGNAGFGRALDLFALFGSIRWQRPYRKAFALCACACEAVARPCTCTCTSHM